MNLKNPDLVDWTDTRNPVVRERIILEALFPNTWALPSDRAVAASPSSQQAVSPLRASIPSAGER